MDRLREWMRRAAGLFHKERRDAELAEELAAHLEMLAEENMERGMTPEEARRAARITLGGGEQIKEAVREQRGLPFVESLIADVRFGLRMLQKNPGFTTIAVLTLALGIGANTAIFTLVDAIMLRSVPIQNPQSLYLLRWTARQRPHGLKDAVIWSGCPYGSRGFQSSACSFSYPVYDEIRSRTDIFSDVAALEEVQFVRMNTPSGLVEVRNEFVSERYFEILGIRPAAGRLIQPSDAVGTIPVAVLSYSYWNSQFDGQDSAIGTTVEINGQPVVIAGVAPANFTGLDPGVSVDMWLPLSMQPTLVPKWLPRDPHSLWLELVARLKPGLSAAQAQAAVSVPFSRATTGASSAIFNSSDAPRIELVAATHAFVTLRRQFERPLMLLLGGVGVLLLIACANIAGLLLSRAAARQKEMAVRLVVGASRARLVRQVLTESTMLSLAGGALGIAIAYWGARSLASFLSFNWVMPLQIDVHPDPRVLAFTFATATLAGIVFGLAPALCGTKLDLTPALKAGGGGARFTLGGGLVVAQVALSIVVLMAAGLFIRTLWNLRDQNFGYETQNVVLVDIEPFRANLTPQQAAEIGPRLQEQFQALRGVTSVGYSQWWLVGSGWPEVEFRSLDTSGSPTATALATSVGKDFFRTMRIPLLSGRYLIAADFDPNLSPQPTLISRSLARSLFGDRNPLGQEFTDTFRGKPIRQVIGVVGDVKTGKLRGEMKPIAYGPYLGGGPSFELRTSQSPAALIPEIRRIVKDMNPNLIADDFSTQEGLIEKNLYQERIFAWLASLFGGLAMALVCIGLYGLLAYEVTQRTAEIGVRRALGALPHNVLSLFVARGIALITAGLAIGVGVALGVTRLLRSMLYGIAPNDWATVGAVVVLLTIVGAIACWIPARRATRVDPMVALRHE